MPRLEVRESCFINGEPFEVGDETIADEATAKLLILSGRAVAAVEKPEQPTTRTRARSTIQPTPKQED
jgi:hypothetical protein